ncbi:MAG: hypothetical protein ACYSUD_02965 [Planctomycetota bacterium]|jgi:hypothetical protein
MSKRTNKSRKRKSTQSQSPKRKKSAKSIDRIEASVQYITGLRGKVPLDQAIKEANALYMKHGGTDNLKEAAYSFKKSSKVMALLNLVKIEDNQISKVK